MGESTKIKSFYEIFIEKFGRESKPREGNNIRVVCPECKHNSLSCNVQTGQIHCFQCGYGKGVRFTGNSSGVPEQPVDKELHSLVSNKIIELCTLSSEWKPYLASRGIYSPEKYSLVSAPYQLDKILLKHFSLDQLIGSGFFYPSMSGYGVSKAINPRRLLIPFWQGNNFVSLKSRSLPNNTEEKRYICAKGSTIVGKPWYKNLEEPYLIITEGELAAVSALEVGYSAIGVPGINTISSTAFLGTISNILQQHNFLRTYIILDTDVGIYKDKNKLSYALQLSKFPNTCIAYLPEKDEKVDLDSYLGFNPLSDFEDFLELKWRERVNTKLYLENIIDRL